MSEPVVNSDTPLSKGRASGYHARSLGTTDEGRVDLDHPNNSRPDIENPFKKLKNLGKLKGNETTIQTEFTKAVVANDLVPGLVLCKCGNRPACLHTHTYCQKVDAAQYYPCDAPKDGTPDWGNQVIRVEFKADETGGNPYDDYEDNISAEADIRKKARGR